MVDSVCFSGHKGQLLCGPRAAVPFVIVLTLLLGACASTPPEPTARYADKVIVDKSERTIKLYNKGQVIREYSGFELGDRPRGHKIRQGDERTPEGTYTIDWRNPRSSFHKSLHISYPNETDRAVARFLGVDPGGMIMIHGRPSWLTSQALEKEYDRSDWTNGCIAVKNHEMDEIWRMVRDGTPITIRP